jgi:hypothetical protein
MTQEQERSATAQRAIDFVRARHSIGTFVTNLRTAILKAV